MDEDRGDQNSTNFYNQIGDNGAPVQNLQVLNKKPKRNWPNLLFASLIVVSLSYLVVFVSLKKFISIAPHLSVLRNIDDIIFVVITSLISILVFALCAVIFSIIGAKVLVSKHKVDYSIKKTVGMMMLFAIVLDLVLVSIANSLGGLPAKHGYDKPVSEWKTFENGDFSFSYPKDTKLSQDNGALVSISAKMVDDGSSFFRKEYVPFEVSIVNPDYYKDIYSDENAPRAKGFAEEVYALNQPTKDSHDPDYGRAAQKVVESDFFGSHAYVLSIIGYYQGPGKAYKLETGGFNEFAYYYLDYKDKLYQIRVPVRDEYGQRILKTLKFVSTQSIKEPELSEVVENIFTADGYINCFSLNQADISDVNLDMSASQNFIRLTQKEKLIDDYSDDYYAKSENKKISYRIADNTKFYIDNKEVGQSKIADLNKDVTGIEKCTGGLKNSYSKATVEYRILQLDDLERNNYFVATSIYLNNE